MSNLKNLVVGISNAAELKSKSSIKGSHKKISGYSLIELMMGTAVLTVVLAGTFSALGQALTLSEKVQHANFVTELLQSELDKIETYNWNAIISLPASGTFDPNSYFTEVPLKNYTCTRTVQNHPSFTNVKEIRFTVTWEDVKGRMHSRELVNYYSKGGMNDYYYEAL